jgi:hypothetical protein
VGFACANSGSTATDVLLAKQLERGSSGELAGRGAVELIETELQQWREQGKSLEDAAAALEDDVIVQARDGAGITVRCSVLVAACRLFPFLHPPEQAGQSLRACCVGCMHALLFRCN